MLTPQRVRPDLPEAGRILQWWYFGRVVVAIIIFAAAALSISAVASETILILAIAALSSLIMSGFSFWHTHVRRAAPTITFFYVQAIFDLALVTALVHVTGGPESQFPALYIVVIAVSAVLMPLASSLLITALAGLLYVALIVLAWQPVQLSIVVWLQVGVFVAVFAAAGFIGSRVRIVGAEREELQQEVRRLRLEAADVLRNIHSGVISTDGDGRVLYANPAAHRLLGLGTAEIVGRSLADLIGETAPRLVGAIETTRANRLKAYRAEGSISYGYRAFPIGVTATCIDVGKEAQPSVTAIFTDISGQKRLDEMHLRTERLQAVAELAASLAHEIKNPLASIRSAVEQLSHIGQPTEDERFLAQLVVRESDRLSRLLNEFLDFSRVQVVEAKPVDLSKVVEGAVEMVRQHPDCPDTIHIDLRHSEALVQGDEDLLHRVVANLVLNAVQASEGQADVGVEVRHAQVGEVPPDLQAEGAVLLRVFDNGPGIPEELREKLFDPFVTGRVGGSGLGLAIVQRAVEAHRGAVLVDSTPGQGSDFRIFIPVGTTGEAMA
jgi:two-component system, NtrC family, sensor histidine kinase PilS